MKKNTQRQLDTSSLEGDHLFYTWNKGTSSALEVLRDTSLCIHNNEFKSIIGPSGSGKTTLLNILGGLLKPDKGVVLLNDEPMGKVSDRLGLPTPSDVGIVFQDYGLFPWLTVEKNVAFGLVVTHVPRVQRNKKVEEVLRRVGLWDFRNHYPHQLSGGMKQRTSIARVLATDAEFLLMDEPFSALDFQTRFFMQEFLLEVWQKFNKTIIYVTHHVDEALILSDVIYLMTARPGKLAEEMKIDLPRPRDTSDPKFFEYRKHIIAFLEKEVKRTFREQK